MAQRTAEAEAARGKAMAERNADPGLIKDWLIAAPIWLPNGMVSSNGVWHAFIADENVRLTGVEAGGKSTRLGEHAARFSGGAPGVLHGARSYLLQDEFGQIAETHSISAGLDYPGVGP